MTIKLAGHKVGTCDNPVGGAGLAAHRGSRPFVLRIGSDSFLNFRHENFSRGGRTRDVANVIWYRVSSGLRLD